MGPRILYLDGLRAVSIIMVLIGHWDTVLWDTGWLQYIGNSHLGIMIFFNLSGFLITSLLLKEIERKGRFSLFGFYTKRILRIFPVFYTYLIVIAGLAFLELIDIESGHFFFASLHVWNYGPVLNDYSLTPDIWYLSHFWTLALEEQYYLLWPLAIFLFDSKKLMKALPFVLFFFPVSRVINYFIFPELRGYEGMLQTMGDSILWGSYAALLLYHRKEYITDKIKVFNKGGILLLFFFIIIVSKTLALRFGGNYDLTIGFTLESICISTIILYLITYKPHGFAFLNNKYIMYIGTLSYSLYIWQQLFLAPNHISLSFPMPFNFILCFVAAFISYHSIERLGLYVRSKLKS